MTAALVSALGGLITLTVLYYRAVKKGSRLELMMLKNDLLAKKNEYLEAELEETENELDRANDYIHELEKQLVENIGPDGLADAINGLFSRRQVEFDTD